MIRNFNLGTRLSLGFGILALLILIQGSMALQNMSRMDASQNEISENWIPTIMALGNLNMKLMYYRVISLRTMADTSAEGISTSETNLVRVGDEVDKAMDKYKSLITEPGEKEIFPQLEAAKARYADNSRRIFEFVKAGDLDQARALYTRDQGKLADQITGYLEKLVEINKKGSDESANHADKVYSESKGIVTSTIAIALLLTGALAYVVTRSITAPINQALDATELVASGNLTRHIQVDGQDEPARLLAGLSQMQSSLRQTITEIANSSSQLAAATEELHHVADEATHNLNRQNDEIQQAATAVTEMSAAVDEVARNATSTSEASNQSTQLARSGRERVLETVSSIQAMTDEVLKSAQLVEGLAEQSQHIGKVMDVIRAIAEQTNLLALNAAIEAARAGEAGRGFAVVADEVRALAHRTQESTREIEQMIKQIQSGADAAVISMRNSAGHTQQTLSIAQESGKALDQISEQSGLISDRNLLIASASEEQAAVAREVDRNIVNISTLAAQSSSGANQTSASASELARLANSLNGLVARFVI